MHNFLLFEKNDSLIKQLEKEIGINKNNAKQLMKDLLKKDSDYDTSMTELSKIKDSKFDFIAFDEKSLIVDFDSCAY